MVAKHIADVAAVDPVGADADREHALVEEREFLNRFGEVLDVLPERVDLLLQIPLTLAPRRRGS